MRKRNLKCWEILTEAKKSLCKDYNETRCTLKVDYLCFAISRVQTKHNNPQVDSSAQKLKSEIMKRLEGCSHYDDWLWMKHKIRITYNYKSQIDKLQFSRYAWLDSLISEYKEKDL